jgi:hypothetical protein
MPVGATTESLVSTTARADSALVATSQPSTASEDETPLTVVTGDMPLPTIEDDVAVDVSGIARGMTQDEVIAACNQRPVPQTIRVLYGAKSPNGEDTMSFPLEQIQRSPRPIGFTDVLGGPYLSDITCGSRTGIVSIRFARPPTQSRVIFVDDNQFSDAIGATTPAAFMARLVTKYGAPSGAVGPTPIDARRGTVARSFKWIFPRNGLDCTVRKGDGYDSQLIGHRYPCAASLTVRTAIDTNANTVLLADLRYYDIREIATVLDRQATWLRLPGPVPSASLRPGANSTESDFIDAIADGRTWLLRHPAECASLIEELASVTEDKVAESLDKWAKKQKDRQFTSELAAGLVKELILPRLAEEGRKAMQKRLCESPSVNVSTLGL